MKKVIENGDDRTEVTVATVNSEENVKKSINSWENLGILAPNLVIFLLKKPTCPRILSFISIKSINLLKMIKNFIITMFP